MANEYKNKPSILDIKQIEGKRKDIDILKAYRDELNKNKMLMIENTKIKDETEFEKMYYSNRELLEDEYNEAILNGLKKIKGDIYIKTGCLNEFIVNQEIKDKVIDLLNNGHKIIVKLGKNNINANIEEIKKLQAKGMVIINTNNYINDKTIIFDSLYMLYTYYEYIDIKSDIPNLKIKKENSSIIYQDDIINPLKMEFENIKDKQ